MYAMGVRTIFEMLGQVNWFRTCFRFGSPQGLGGENHPQQTQERLLGSGQAPELVRPTCTKYR